MIVAIDGPAGSGKSSTAKAVAERLGFLHLDSGAWYRALTLAALRAGPEPHAWDDLDVGAVAALGVTAAFRDGGLRMSIEGREVPDDDLRGGEVTRHVSRMASIPAVRSWLLERQREQARAADVVVDGRDIGTVVFPDAELKVFLDARPEVRAKRRLLQRGVHEPTAREVAAEAALLRARDERDAGRPIAPLRRAEDAVLVDTSDLTFDQQVGVIVGLARARASSVAGRGETPAH